jgi:ABC-type Mn2+/Zn2+ transport system ATPase subunit
MKREKKIVIIAGPNGAGKTTFAREFLPNEAGNSGERPVLVEQGKNV